MHFPMNFRSCPSLPFAQNALSFSYSLMSVPTCVATCNTSPVSNITSLSHSTMNNHQEVSPSSPHPQPSTDANANVPLSSNNASTSTETTSTLRVIVLTNFPQKNLFFPFCSEEYVRKFFLSGRKSNNMGWECVHFIDVPELICMIAQDEDLPSNQKVIKKSYPCLNKIIRKLSNVVFSPKDGKTEPSAPKKQSDQYLHYVICKHCQNNPTKTLDNAAICLSSSRITNFKMNHMKNHHHMSLEGFLASQTCASTICSLSNMSSATKSKGTTTQPSLAHFKKPKHNQKMIR